MSDTLVKNPWQSLRQFTNARIALGRAGSGMPTEPLLAFNLAHAQARDAVHHPLDVDALRARLADAGFANVVDVHSAAPDRAHYLRRPDLGRRLADESRALLDATCARDHDVLFVIADGLSAFAASKQAVPFLQAILSRLDDWNIGPVVIARQGRVALADEIGEVMRARIVVMLIGERPGLSSPDSLGIYVTYAPAVGRSDAERNCISNVRPEGLNHDAAAYKLHYLLTHARRLGLTGVALKDDSDAAIAAKEPLTSIACHA
ncbi:MULTISPECIES: ethanolamine ammonia-lyase subunit EutC [unclassified Caballeronia]|uniref:ethanolamine ammonia-lyase subunit EutC n=1 Tax=unclassified Caballeronia TaxID=2646786 RepID=UPI00285A8878|nr:MULTISPECIES: ethanolamine ammonia-lyase subunit EutC [unclassified Caballeronia]MDR5774191.1 ethanolamine ammonia-lyase subunit EutC [Caballeronia sp. LZ002]MDR5849626.1 ethanolamine ammonia-lyase subunit EutC [Caballeronia sp. LZ003]